MNSTTNKETFRDKFGFLFVSETITFDMGTITPLQHYNESKSWIEENSMDSQGEFLFPPIVDPKTVTLNLGTGEFQEKKIGPQRAAHLWKVPSSHELCLNCVSTPEKFRKGVGALIVYLLSYLYGTRLQFEDWCLDGRIPIKSHHVGLDMKTVEKFLSHACRTWQTWSDEQKGWFINTLYMNSRSPSYEWKWEQFIINYMVFDACFALAMKLRPVREEYWKKYYNSKKQIPHKPRFKIMCEEYGTLFEEEHIEKIYALRNPLFHQGLWDKSMPGMEPEKSDVFIQANNLRNLNHRLIPALLGYQTNYIKTSWSSLTRFHFGSGRTFIEIKTE